VSENIHQTAIIEDNVIIECNNFTLGKGSIIKSGCIITCNEFNAGDGLYMNNNVEVGRGGCNGPDSNVFIGNNVGIFENTIINPSSEIHIGNNVSLGDGAMIWTHGSWLDVLQGFPADFGPVKIGNNVWLPPRIIILPNVEIGDNVVVGIGSLINRSLPSGCMAAGNPCKVIKKDCYPKQLSSDQKCEIVSDIVTDWHVLHASKKIQGIETQCTGETIRLQQGEHLTTYDLEKRTIDGHENEVSEDLRDYLRRRGIKIFTEKPFCSIKPSWKRSPHFDPAFWERM